MVRVGSKRSGMAFSPPLSAAVLPWRYPGLQGLSLLEPCLMRKMWPPTLQGLSPGAPSASPVPGWKLYFVSHSL